MGGYRYDIEQLKAAIGGGGGPIDHGGLGGLGDDDHPQYYNAARLSVALGSYLTTAAAAALYQPLDSDLTTIAGLTATTDNFMQAKAGAWASRTVAQVKSDLGISGSNTGDQTITLTGDVTGSGTGSFAATIANDAVTYAKMQNVSATSRFLGRITSGAGDIEELTGTQATTLLDAFSTSLKGVVPASGGGVANYMRADGTWANPSMTGVGAAYDPNIRFDCFDDFDASFNSFWIPSATGGSAARLAIAGRPGCLRFSSGIGGTNFYAAIRAGATGSQQEYFTYSDTYPLTVETEIRVPTLPDGTNTFTSGVGLCATLTGTDSQCRIGIAWDSGAAQARFRVNTRNSGGTAVSTYYATTAPSANTWYRMRLVFTATDIRGYVYLSGSWTLIATMTATLPDQGMAPSFNITKSAGGSTRTLDIDYVWVYQDIAAGRPA